MIDLEIAERMKVMREKVKGLIRPGLADHGDNQWTLQCNIHKTKRGNNEEYTTRRLQRDKPELARR